MTTPMLRRLAMWFPMVLLAGCVLGGWSSQVREGAHGATVRLQVADDLTPEGWSDDRFEAELLEVGEDGLLLMGGGILWQVSWSSIRRLDVRDYPVDDLEDGIEPSPQHREALRLASRYPFGLTADQRAALLESTGRDAPERVGSDPPRHLPHPATTDGPAAEHFVRVTRAATRRFTDRSEAIRAGYRKLGPDFPGMGEHWVHPGGIVRGTLDASRPPVLSYVELEDETVLVGVAFTLPLGPDETPPTEPFGADVWHDHSGDVDEETLLLNHPATLHGGGGGHRLSMVHVWTDLENPDGVLAQNNWRLPWVRVGLEPPSHPSPEAARGVSLAYGGRAFYRELIDRAAEFTVEENGRLDAVLDRYATRVEGLVQAALRDGGTADPGAFAEAWEGLWEAVRASVGPAAWAGLAPLSERARD